MEAPPPEVDDETVLEIEDALAEAPPAAPEVVAPVKPSFRDRLAKARGAFSGAIGSVLSRSNIDTETWDDLEEALLRADVGIGLTTDLLDSVRARVKEQGITEPQALLDAVKLEMKSRLVGDRTLRFEPGAPNVWLFVGVNGVGKTTTIGKVGQREIADGRSVVMAAGDTFRAAAAEQLGLWAERVGADLVRGSEGGDPSSVIFDAVEHAGAKNFDLVLADTAGRLHTKTNLMEELRKVRRVADKDPGKVTEVLLVLDATTGQNGLVQAQQSCSRSSTARPRAASCSRSRAISVFRSSSSASVRRRTTSSSSTRTSSSTPCSPDPLEVTSACHHWSVEGDEQEVGT